MRKIIILFLLGISSYMGYTQDRAIYKELFSNGKDKDVFYKRGSDVPFTGVVERYFYNGALEETTDYVKGKPDGIRKRYHNNGMVEYEVKFKNGKEVGQRKTYSKDGVLVGEWTYVNGAKDGLVKEYYRDGILKSVSKYHNGSYVATVMNYNEKGNLLYYSSDISKGGTEYSYHDNGKVSREYNTGLNIEKTYYETGVLKSESDIKKACKKRIMKLGC